MDAIDTAVFSISLSIHKDNTTTFSSIVFFELGVWDL
uniref:Uncharacterized protein n=1 Tax=Anguilla anguilla TaxID=7936 RepID=A0A0E9WC23_ANGAN